MERLFVSGTLPLLPEDGVPGWDGLVLLSPDEPGFWAHVTMQPEFVDGRPDALDRWSARVIGALAARFGARALFPFGGPPYYPFVRWALRSGRARPSPVSLLVHDRMGLMASWRGALAVAEVPEATPSPDPCATCATRPCLAACPPRALTASGYDLPACHGFLDIPAGTDCMDFGCGVRRACPVSQAYGRLPEQSAYHMGYFHR